MEFGPVAGNYVVLSVVARMASLPGPLLESDHSAGHGRQPRAESTEEQEEPGMLRSLFLRAAVALLALPLLALACGQPGAQQSTMTPENLFVTSKPGTVMVLADFKAHLTVPDAKLDDARLEYLKNRAVDMILAGQLPSDQNAIVNWMIDQILGDPIAYFVPTNQIPRPFSEPAGESLSAQLELFLLCLLVLFQ